MCDVSLLLAIVAGTRGIRFFITKWRRIEDSDNPNINKIAFLFVKLRRTTVSID